MLKNRLIVALAIAGVLTTASLATARTDAPKSSTTSKTLYLSQVGCGAEAEDGKLLPTIGLGDSAGCGTIGGVPVDEVVHQLGSTSFTDFTSTTKTKPFKVNAAKKVTGQLRADSWIGAGGGVGSVDFDIKLKMETTKGVTITFAPITVSQAASPTSSEMYLPFAMPFPKGASGTTVKSIVMSVALRGMNVPFSAFGMDGDSYVLIPAKK